MSPAVVRTPESFPARSSGKSIGGQQAQFVATGEHTKFLGQDERNKSSWTKLKIVSLDRQFFHSSDISHGVILTRRFDMNRNAPPVKMSNVISGHPESTISSILEL